MSFSARFVRWLRTSRRRLRVRRRRSRLAACADACAVTVSPVIALPFQVCPRTRMLSVRSGWGFGGQAHQLSAALPEGLRKRLVLGLGAGREHLLILDVLAGQ